MLIKIRFDNNYVYSADEKNDYIGRIVAGNNQVIKIQQSDGKHIYASFGITDSQGNFYVPCTNTVCRKVCIGLPPYGIFCRYNSVSMSMGAFYIKT